MRIAIVTALWQRPELTKLCLQYYADLHVPGIDLLRVAAFSPEDTEFRPHHGWFFVPAPNEPLSDKFNTAMQAARELRPDAVLVLGSDDFVDAEFILASADLSDRGIVYPQAMYFYSTETGECFYATTSRGGGGRVLSAGLLDQCDWAPWPSGLSKGLDQGMDEHLGPVWSVSSMNETLLCVKLTENLWSFDHVRMLRRKDVDAEAFLNERFPSIAGQLLATCEPLVITRG